MTRTRVHVFVLFTGYQLQVKLSQTSSHVFVLFTGYQLQVFVLFTGYQLQVCQVKSLAFLSYPPFPSSLECVTVFYNCHPLSRSVQGLGFRV